MELLCGFLFPNERRVLILLLIKSNSKGLLEYSKQRKCVLEFLIAVLSCASDVVAISLKQLNSNGKYKERR